MTITPWDTHQPRKAGNIILSSSSYATSLSDHAGTLAGAPKHFDTTSRAISINQIPLKDCYTSAIALDLSHIELKTACCQCRQMEKALAKSGRKIRDGDTVLLCTVHNRCVPYDDLRWQHDFPGSVLESVHWFMDNGCKVWNRDRQYESRWRA